MAQKKATKTTNIDIDTNLDTHFLDNFDCFGCDFSLNASGDETHSLGPSPMGTTLDTTNEDESYFSEEPLQIGTVFNTTNQDESHFSEERHEDNGTFGYTESSITATDDNNRPNLCNTLPEDSFLSKSSMCFIQLLSTHQNIGIAVCTIVALVAHGAKKINHHHIMNIDKDDFILFLEMAQLVTSIGSRDRERFCRILSLYKKNSYSYHRLPLPTSLTRCRHMILRNDCAYSLLNLLPLPKILDDNKGHAYISLLSFLQHALLFPSKPKKITTTKPYCNLFMQKE